jgi:hypothetical protein
VRSTGGTDEHVTAEDAVARRLIVVALAVAIWFIPARKG